MKSYGIIEQGEASDPLERSAEELKWQGSTVLEEILSGDELDEARGRLDKVYERQVEEEEGEPRLKEIGEANLARMPLMYDDWFLRLPTERRLLEFVRFVLGEYVILHLQNGIINRPEETHHQASWHRDLPYQEWTSSKPLALGALFCIDDFSEETGGTLVLPGSHRMEVFPSRDYVSRFSRTVSAPAGSVIIFDAMLYHRAGENRSPRPRRAINHVFTIPILKQQIDLPRGLEGKFREDAEVARLLGYDSAVKASVREWRESRRGRKK